MEDDKDAMPLPHPNPVPTPTPTQTPTLTLTLILTPTPTLSPTPPPGEMPLHKLSRQGCLEATRGIIDILIKTDSVKIDLNWQDKQGKTPIFYAAEYVRDRGLASTRVRVRARRQSSMQPSTATP